MDAQASSFWCGFHGASFLRRPYLRRRTRLPALQVLWWVAAFFGLTLLGRQQPQLLNGSLAYAPALLVLFALGLREWRRQGPLLVICAGLFALSLLLRSVDLMVCPWLPLGTHPLWHLLNAAVLAGVSAALKTPVAGRTDGVAETSLDLQ